MANTAAKAEFRANYEVQARAPRARYRLKPGERCAITPKWAHIVRSAGPGAVRFLIVQGPGAYDYIPVGGADQGIAI